MKIDRNKDIDDSKLQALLKEFEESTEIKEQGLGYKRYDIRELYEIFPDAFRIKPELTRSQAIELFGQALRDCRQEGSLTADAIIQRATAILKNRRAVPARSYTLWTKFRARTMAQCESVSLDWRGVSLRTAHSLPSNLDIDGYFLNGVGRIQPREPYGYGHVILSCKERDEDQAVHRMMDTLQLIYGLCNIYLTFGAFVERSGWNWTEGELWMGPYQFLFDGERFTGEERIWYNPDFDKETWDRHPPDMNRVVTIIPRVREALNKLETHAFGDTLIESIRLMQDGFATRDGSYRLLRYWSALERLYLQKGEIDGSKELIQRATFADRDSDIFRWKLVHISKLRNDYVHSGGRKGDIQPMCQFMRHLLERHINYWIFSSDDLSSHSEMLDFVKLPRDQATLESRMRIIERRLSMLNG